MVHRVFRFSISPERAPEVRRVVDFDGRSTLHDVHHAIQRELNLNNQHLNALFGSGRFFGRSSEHSKGVETSYDSRRSVLFRLGLKAGQELAYSFGGEHRHAVTVVSITDVEAPLAEPVLVESVGEAPAQRWSLEEDEEPYELPEHLTELAPLAETVLALSERLDELYAEDEAEQARIAEGDDEIDDDESTEEDDDEEFPDEDATNEPAGPPEAILSVLRELAKAALELAPALKEDEEVFQELDQWSQERELLPRLAELPLGLVNVGELDSALAVARAFTFIAPESFNADIAIIFAESGKRDEAIAQLESNLKQFPESCLTAVKSGEAFEVLGDLAAAEVSYRRAMELAEDENEEEEALSQLVGLLEDMGRSEEIDALLPPSNVDDEPLDDDEPFADNEPLDDADPLVVGKRVVDAKPLAPVGRNEPCPCGSGKKYKKCHGA